MTVFGRNLPKWHRFRPNSITIVYSITFSIGIYRTIGLAPYLLLVGTHEHSRGHLEENQTGADELGNGFLALGEEGFLAIL